MAHGLLYINCKLLNQQLKVNKMRDKLIQAYLDWKNNYLSIATYAEHNGLTIEQACKLIALMKDVFTTEHPDA